MSKLAYAGSFRDLVAYQKSRSVAREVFRVTKRFPREETYALTSQIRRSSRSIGAQIAEAWAKRRYVPHFTSKLTDADAEQQETQHWVETALDCGYVSADEAKLLIDDLTEIGRMLGSMTAKADQFCGSGGTMMRENAVVAYTLPATSITSIPISISD